MEILFLKILILIMKNKYTKYILNSIKGCKKKIFLFFIIYFITDVFLKGILLPYILGIFAELYKNNKLNIQNISIISFLLILCNISFPLSRILFVENLFYNGIIKAGKKININLVKYCLNHSLKFYNNKMSGFINQKINNVSTSFVELCDKGTESLATIFLMLYSIIIYFKINIKLMFIIILYIVSYYIFKFFYLKNGFKKRKNLTNLRNNLFSNINDILINIQNVKSFSRYNEEKNNINDNINSIYIEHKKCLYYDEKMNHIYKTILNTFFLTVILCYSYNLFYIKKISITHLIFIFQNVLILKKYIEFDTFRVRYLIDLTNNIYDGLKTILEKHEINDKKNAKNLKIKDGKIEFKNINFIIN